MNSILKKNYIFDNFLFYLRNKIVMLAEKIIKFDDFLFNRYYDKIMLVEKIIKFPEKQAETDFSSVAETLLTVYGNNILRLAYSYLHNMSDAEDILQDTIIQYLKTKPVFESKAHAKAWALRVAGNLSKNRIKYNQVRETDELMEELVGKESEDLSFVWDAVKQLPDKYRGTIHLFYYEHYSTKEIADILNYNESTVRSHLKRGREQLKEILKEEYDFE